MLAPAAPVLLTTVLAIPLLACGQGCGIGTATPRGCLTQATGQRIEATVRFGEALRKYRERQKVSLNELHELTFFSKSYLSRVERGERNPERVLAELADEALGANGRLVKAWDSDYAPTRTIVGSSGGEATKRRQFITSAALVAGVGFDDLAGQPDPSTAAVARLRDALIPTTPTSHAALPVASLARALTRAQRDFAAARYLPLQTNSPRSSPLPQPPRPPPQRPQPHGSITSRRAR